MTPVPASPPSVAVVIPLYNKARYVGRAMDSILAQTYQDFEVVVVDDGSTDAGPAIVEKYGDPRIRLIRQANAGPGVARNRGIRESTAPLVAFLDADDEYLPAFLERAVGHLEAVPECAASMSGRYEGAARALLRFLGPESLAPKPGPWRMPPDINGDVLRYYLYWIQTCVVCARREVVLALGGFYDRGRCTYGEDVYLWLKILLCHPVSLDPEPLTWVHTEDSSLSWGRRTRRPLSPALTDPAPLRALASPEYRSALESYRQSSLLHHAGYWAKRGAFGEALRLLRWYQAEWGASVGLRVGWQVLVRPWLSVRHWVYQSPALAGVLSRLKRAVAGRHLRELQGQVRAAVEESHPPRGTGR